MTLTHAALLELADVFREYAKAANKFEQTEISVEHVKGWGKPDVIQRRQDDLHRDKCIRDEKLALLDQKLDEYIDRKIEDRIQALLSRRDQSVQGLESTKRLASGPSF